CADAPEHAAFRREFRAWLDANLTDDLKVEDASDSRVAPDRETLEKRIAWQKKMYAAGWVGISWPKEYGGRGAICNASSPATSAGARASRSPGLAAISRACGPAPWTRATISSSTARRYG